MPHSWGEFVCAEGNEENKADKEGETSGNDEECSKLVKVSVCVVSAVGFEEDAMTIFVFEVFVANSSN
jgi:hypothetical protein